MTSRPPVASSMRQARAIRRQISDLNAALQRILLSRAFTCYQMVVMLDEVAAAPFPIPTLALDLLATFYDENVTLVESQRLLRGCIRRLQQVSQQVPVIVSVHLPSVSCPMPTPSHVPWRRSDCSVAGWTGVEALCARRLAQDMNIEAAAMPNAVLMVIFVLIFGFSCCRAEDARRKRLRRRAGGLVRPRAASA